MDDTGKNGKWGMKRDRASRLPPTQNAIYYKATIFGAR
jgi:hypothetical protein